MWSTALMYRVQDLEIVFHFLTFNQLCTLRVVICSLQSTLTVPYIARAPTRLIPWGWNAALIFLNDGKVTDMSLVIDFLGKTTCNFSVRAWNGNDLWLLGIWLLGIKRSQRIGNRIALAIEELGCHRYQVIFLRICDIWQFFHLFGRETFVSTHYVAILGFR
jgi:hypothetical protein